MNEQRYYFGIPFEVRASKDEPASAEPKFKVGDRVRFTDAVSPSWFFKAGETGLIIEDDQTDYLRFRVKCDSNDNSANVDAEHIELAPTFAIGDRVKLKRNTIAFAIGDKGVVSTADGEFVGVYMEPNGFFSYFTPDMLAADCPQDNLQQDNGETKFKAGNRVRIIEDSWGDTFPVGEFGTIQEVLDHCVTVSRDGHGDYGWCFNTDEIELAPPSLQPCIVARVLDGQPRPSNIPYMHASSADALAEAERLAKNNPGQEFAVYQRVGARVASVEYKMKEVA